jgi:hypothetical protein
MLLDPGGDFRHVGHEDRVAEQEVVGWEDRHRGLRVAPGDPVRWVEHAGGGAAIERLRQDLRRAAPGNSRRCSRRDGGTVTTSALRDGERHAIERLPQQRARAQETHVLLRAVGTEHLADQGPEAHALSSGQDHRPAALLSHAREILSILLSHALASCRRGVELPGEWVPAIGIQATCQLCGENRRAATPRIREARRR